ncbi:MAG: cytochrome c3 family protein [Gemmatimonadaceae bacterium]|nr:cytochrome c3 family protein [Gemmatimonadaceae bacterium]
MTPEFRDRLTLRGAMLLVMASLAGCVDEKIVYRDGPNYAAPPTAAASFLGYSDATSKATVCGSCHVSQQGKWKSTKHAGAFSTLEKSGQMEGLCQACHTVNNLGNVATDTSAGWRTTKDKRYHDVQCESCHGAGLQHVQTPARGQMLPSIKADTGKAITNGCSECHSGTHQPFVEEWRTSRHATSYTRAYNGTTATAPEVPGGPRAACQGCHIGQKVLEAWGVNTNFTEKSQGQTAASAVGVACAVCHDPHGSTNSKQLRFAVDSRDPDNNLCMKCHLRRAVPDFSSSYGTRPHSPQGPMLLGTAGWWPPGIEVDGDLVASHGTERNPKLCASCHVNRYQVTDKATGKFVQTVTGHRFDAIPCVDANGLPTPSQTCTITQRSFKSCAASGCHTESSARTIMVTAEADIKFLAAALDVMLKDPKIPATELAVGKVTTARGARFNYNLALFPGSDVHNPFLAKALLRASIAQVAKDYGLTPPPGLKLAPYDKLILARGN